MKVRPPKLKIDSEELVLESEKDFRKVYNLSSSWEDMLNNGNLRMLRLICYDLDLHQFPAIYRKDIHRYASHISSYISKLLRVMETISDDFSPIPGFEDVDL